MPQNIGLGRGLAALIPPKANPLAPEREKEDKDQYVSFTPREMPIVSIKPHPNQPRKYLESEKLEELANSIREHGILQPLVVNTKNQLVIGQRRLEAAKMAGLETVPVIVKEEDPQKNLEMSIIENLQREDLNPVDAAQAYQCLIDKFNLSQEEIAKRVGKGRSTVTNTLRMLALPLVIQRGVREGRITEGHAKVILSLGTAEQRIQLYEVILERGLTVERAEKVLRKMFGETPHGHKIRKGSPDPIFRKAEEFLQESLGTHVFVKRTAKVGRIMIEFYSYDELKGILKKFK